MDSFISFYREFMLPYGLGTIMFGMGLTLAPEDFRRIVSGPRAVVAALLGQIVLLPAIAIGIASVLPLSGLIAASLVIVSACPGGISSNAVIFAVKGDVALSVTLTAFSSCITVFTIPLIASFALGFYSDGAASIDLPIFRTLQTLMTVALIPIMAGMLVKAFAAMAAQKLSRFLRRISGWLLLAIIVIGTILAVDFAQIGIAEMVLVSLLFSVVTILAGYFLGAIFGLGPLQQMTVAVEVGLQNVAMAMLIANTILHRPEFAVVPGLYGGFMFLSVFVFIRAFKKRYLPMERNNGKAGAAP